MAERPNKRQRSESYGEGGQNGGSVSGSKDQTKKYVFQHFSRSICRLHLISFLPFLHDSASHGKGGRHAALRAARWLHISHCSIKPSQNLPTIRHSGGMC